MLFPKGMCLPFSQLYLARSTSKPSQDDAMSQSKSPSRAAWVDIGELCSDLLSILTEKNPHKHVPETLRLAQIEPRIRLSLLGIPCLSPPQVN